MLNEEIPFESNSFDFIFVRSAGLWYTNSQWEEIILPELIRILKPGGYLEFMDVEMKIFGEGQAPIMTKYAERCLYFFFFLHSKKINIYL
jgi:ubiquinone/menaquinone biosynthesis C-methylase UbiE